MFCTLCRSGGGVAEPTAGGGTGSPDRNLLWRNEMAQMPTPETERKRLEELQGKVWDTSELQRDFTVESFAAPYVLVTKQATSQKGTMLFQHRPRYYFDFVPDTGRSK